MRRRFDTAPVFRPLTEIDANAMLGWHYEGPYSRYDSRPEDLAGLLDPANAYFAVATAEDELLGFCCFGPDARVTGGEYQDESAVDVGGGLRPDLTGKGLGISFLRAILDFARQQFAAETYRVTIAAFNQRAIRMCRWAGFEPTERFTAGSSDEPREFVVLTMKA
jgi:RimJ/RimL family protein N-acetyltransferase